MPSSPLLAHTGLAVIGSVAFLALFVGFATSILSFLLLLLYRARVGHLMSPASPAPVAASTVGAEAVPRAADTLAGNIRHARESSVAARADARAEALYRETQQGPRRLAGRYAIAGAAFALSVGTAAFVAFSQIQVNYLHAASHLLQLALLVWIVAWPIVMTTNIAATGSLRWIGAAVYFAGLAIIGTALSIVPTEPPVRLGEVTLPGWSGESPLRVAAKWGLFNAAPTLLVFVFHRRRLRAVAPLVLAFMSVVGAGLLVTLVSAFAYSELSAWAMTRIVDVLGVGARAAAALYLVGTAIAACLAFALIGWQLLAWIRRQNERKTSSDQSLTIASRWLVFAAFYAGVLAYGGAAWACAPLAGLLVFRLAFRMTGCKRPEAQAPSLLVLRVFSLGRQSELLFDAVTRRWRHAGTVNLIAGTDLAGATVAPRQFLAFLTGRLQHLFVRSRSDVDAALATIDRRRDADGRFRINDFFCSAHSWQALLTRLVPQADVVLMDLRRFSSANAGCIFEIEALLRTVAVEQLIFVADASTDRESFADIVRKCCGTLAAHTPNAGLSAADVPLFSLQRPGSRQVDALLQALCAAAARRVTDRQPGPALRPCAEGLTVPDATPAVGTEQR